MSTSIHLNIEFKHPIHGMSPVIANDFGDIGGYELYAALAGVRNRDSKPILISPRGFPRDACRALIRIYYLQVLDSTNEEPKLPRYCTKQEARLYRAQFNVEERSIGVVNAISDPDFHHATYLTRSETIDVCKYFGYDIAGSSPDFQIALDILKLVDSHYGEGASRFVLWFA